jgi:hypothetical protein
MSRLLVVWVLFVAGCSEPPVNRTLPPPTPPSRPDVVKQQPSCDPQEPAMRGERLNIRETTQPEISNHLVGVANIFERELPDASGTVARRVSAQLVISAPGSDDIRRETVYAGSIVSIGSDRYCVVAVDEGTSAPGSLTLEKLAP